MKINIQQEERIINLTNFLWEQIIVVNCNLDIILLLSKMKKNYPEAMALSPAFYSLTYKSSIESCLSIITRLYDKNGKSTIISLLEWCEKNPEAIVAIQNKVGNKQITLNHFKSVMVEGRKEFNSMLPKLLNLTKLRDKVISHNDSKSLDSLDKVINENPIYFLDIKYLIDFASEFTKCIITYLTTVVRNQHAKNISDLEITLKKVDNVLKKDTQKRKIDNSQLFK
ncbi:hypothetical protein [Enterococcus sp. AZ177]|uniref:AbiU2 domain-containing protein n=1 Tax=unclassified Enterococcus TaxID=2608891 RepID=UPI003D2FBA58